MANAKNYTKMLAESMRNTKEIVASNIWWDKHHPVPLSKYKLHMHMKKDWRILELREVDGRSGYYFHSSYKSFKEAEAIKKLMEGNNYGNS